MKLKVIAFILILICLGGVAYYQLQPKDISYLDDGCEYPEGEILVLHYCWLMKYPNLTRAQIEEQLMREK